MEKKIPETDTKKGVKPGKLEKKTGTPKPTTQPSEPAPASAATTGAAAKKTVKSIAQPSSPPEKKTTPVKATTKPKEERNKTGKK